VDFLCKKLIFFKKVECEQWRNGKIENERCHWLNCHGRTLWQPVNFADFNQAKKILFRYFEMGFTPHDFAYQRSRGLHGYSNLDDPRVKFLCWLLF